VAIMPTDEWMATDEQTWLATDELAPKTGPVATQPRPSPAALPPSAEMSANGVDWDTVKKVGAVAGVVLVAGSVAYWLTKRSRRR
jgi:hypothetical protein